VPSAAQDLDPRVRNQPQPRARELGRDERVARAPHDQRRSGDLAGESVPHRGHGAARQRRGAPPGRIAHDRPEERRRRRRQGPRETSPVPRDGNPIAGPDGRDEDETPHEVGPLGRDRRRDEAAERVADEVRFRLE